MKGPTMRVKVIPEQRVFVTCDGQQFLHRSEAERHIETTAAACLLTIGRKVNSGRPVSELLLDAGLVFAVRDYLKCVADIELKEE